MHTCKLGICFDIFLGIGNNENQTLKHWIFMIYRAAMMEGSGTLEDQLEATKVIYSTSVMLFGNAPSELL